MRRGQFVVVAMPGEYGKPRPALVVQSDLFADLPSVVICPLTSTLREDVDLIRVTVQPSERNGLRATSQIAIDKITVAPLARIGGVIGEADDALLLRVNRALALFLSIGPSIRPTAPVAIDTNNAKPMKRQKPPNAHSMSCTNSVMVLSG